MHAWSHLVNPLLAQLGSRIHAQTKGVREKLPFPYLRHPPNHIQITLHLFALRSYTDSAPRR